MSTINTNGINANYPIPGVNNSSQGFRDNFAAIKNNINIAATEITDIQNNAIFKNALANTTLDNNMANALISNAAVRGFRAPIYNIGNALSGIVTIDVTMGDVQIGAIAGNTVLQFVGWSPSGTQSNVSLQLAISNANASISFPPQALALGMDVNFSTIENSNTNGLTPYIKAPANVSQLNYRLSTVDCGQSILVEPYNRPRQAAQIDTRTPPPPGHLGDMTGTISTDVPLAQPVYVTSANGVYNYFTCASTNGFFLDMPVVFTGNIISSVQAGTTYYIHSVPTANTFCISREPGNVNGPGPILELNGAAGNMQMVPKTYLNVATGNYTANAIRTTILSTGTINQTIGVTQTKATGNWLVCADTTSLVKGYPITFSTSSFPLPSTYAIATYTGNVILSTSTTGMVQGGQITFIGTSFGNITANTSYYIGDVISNTGPNSNSIGFTIANSYNNAMSNTAVELTANIAGNLLGMFGGMLGGVQPNIVYSVGNIGNATHFQISEIEGRTPLAVTNENGSMLGWAVEDYIIQLNPLDSNTIPTMSQINAPIVFDGAGVPSGLLANNVYYIAAADSANSRISISATSYDGIAGQKVHLPLSNGKFASNTYVGPSIWKSIPLQPITATAANPAAPTWVTIPTSSTSNGLPGDMSYDSGGNLYICIATNRWSRISGNTTW